MTGTLLTDIEIDQVLTAHSEWERDGDGLRRSFDFPDFVTAFGFMSSVALIAERLFHHPEWSNVWGTVVIRITDHDAGGVSTNDREFVERVDKLASAADR